MDTENLFHIEPSDLISDDEDEGVISIDVGLLPSSKGNEYRIFNDTTKPYQRTNAVDRKGRVNIRCKILDIVHGTLSPIGPPVYVSLVVLKCAFFSRKHSSRAVSADVQFIFKGLGQGAPDPEVADMTPRGKYCLMPATQQESVTTGATAGVQAPVAGQASLNWQRVSGREKKKYTTLLGETGVYERNSGDDNGLGWTLLENTITHDGVQSHSRELSCYTGRTRRVIFRLKLPLLSRQTGGRR